MAQTSIVEYSSLKHSLLKIWVPVTGVRKASNLWKKNLEKLINMDKMPCVIKNWIRPRYEKFLPMFRFEPGFERYFDTQPPFQLGEAILAGSLSEGLFLYTLEPPDMDFMFVLKNITFSQEDQEDGCLLLREDTPFLHAFVTNKETQNMWREFFSDADTTTGKQRLSSRKLKEKLQENYRKGGCMFSTIFGKEETQEVTEGAAMTINKAKLNSSYCDCLLDFINKFLSTPINESFDGRKEYAKCMGSVPDIVYSRIVLSSDVVLAIFCEGWPSCAREWITRERFWPDKCCVDNIVQNGFHIVPKSSPDGDFRLSFSCAETLLIQNLSTLQHKVMRAFKGVVKFHQKSWSQNLNEIVSSYHLKTIAFWHFEKTSQEFWTDESLVHHLVTLLENLAEALRKQHLPMYFMPKVNLLEDVDDPEVTLDIMENISELSHNFSTMSEAVNKIISLREIFGKDYKDLARIFDAIREGKIGKTDEGGKSSITWYDLFDFVQTQIVDTF